MKKICVVVSSRSELHLLKYLVQEIEESPQLELQLVVTGSLVSPEFVGGVTAFDEWDQPLAGCVEMLLSSDTRVGASKAIGLGVTSFADLFHSLCPDIVVLTGDRYELLAPAVVALLLNVPIAHIHGGEVTEGALDDSVRHALTKFSALHFVAAAPYAERVRQLGEDSEAIHVVGGLGVDAIQRSNLLTRTGIEDQLGFQIGSRSALVTFHPVTRDPEPSDSQMKALLQALDDVRLDTIIFTGANADPAGKRLNEIVQEYVQDHSNAKFIYSLGDPLYASTVREVDVLVGNSSSGLLEAPSLGTPTVNIGLRQEGRLRSPSVIDCKTDRSSIREALLRALSVEFRQEREVMNLPYGWGGASKAIRQILEDCDLASLAAPKKFQDTVTSGSFVQ